MSEGIGAIVYDDGVYWIRRAAKGYEVYKNNAVTSARCAFVGYTFTDAYGRALAEVKRRTREDAA